jgi:hypothetical protein
MEAAPFEISTPCPIDWKSGAEENSIGVENFVTLVVLWFLGLVTSYTMGGFIHILLVLAIVVLLIRTIQGRRPAT